MLTPKTVFGSLLIVASSWLSAPALAGTEASSTIQELRRHMFDASVNTLTFRSMDVIFPTRKVARAGGVWQLPRADTELNVSYEFEGSRYDAQQGLERTYTNALLVIKDGRIVTEIYRNNSGPSTHFISWSMAKSITSTLVGLAIEDGYIGSLSDPVIKYVPELHNSGYKDVTVRQALQMRSGVAWQERYDFGVDSPAQRAFELGLVRNSIRYVDPAIELKRAHPPGAVFNYSTIETSVLGWVLERALKRPIATYMAERLWEPAGMEADGFWLMDGPPGVGREFTGAGFNAVLRDYGRLGLMVLEGGRANGRQVISADWLKQATVPTVADQPGLGYGYQWWTVPGTHAYMAMGLQGQYIFIDPETRTVVVKLSYFPPGDSKAGAETEQLLQAISAWRP
jgi:CubicO group peptidase (beta-lactamase class C family)